MNKYYIIKSTEMPIMTNMSIKDIAINLKVDENEIIEVSQEEYSKKLEEWMNRKK